MSVIQVYDPTTAADDESIDTFYERLEETLTKNNKDFTLVTGDLDVKIGDVSSHKEVMGCNGLGLQNGKGMALNPASLIIRSLPTSSSCSSLDVYIHGGHLAL